MKATDRRMDSAGRLAEYSRRNHRPGHAHIDDREEQDHPEHDHQSGAAEYVRLGLLGIIVITSLTGWWRPFMNRDWLAFAGTVIGGFPIYKEAWENLLKRRMTMELSMTIALLSALAIGQFFTAIVIAFFVLFAELLEGYTVGGGRRAIEKLVNALPRHVTVRRNGQQSELKADELSIGEVIVIRPGERIPVDGTVIKGCSYVDQSSITGESLPIEKTEQSKVFAGTINKNGVLEVSVERIGRDTTFGRIIQVVEQAEKSKAPVQRIADRLAAGLVYFALGAAVLTFLVTRNLTATIAVIIVAGACGVAAGTPLAILAGIGSAARRGIIVKGGLYLEKLAEIDTVVLDKTGTLTMGVPEVTGIRVADGATEREVLENAAIAEQHSEHPIGEAVIRKSRAARISLREYSDLQYIPGKGVTCLDRGSKVVVGTRTLLEENGIDAHGAASFQGDTRPGETLVYVGRNTTVLGALTIADQLRSEAIQAVDQLKKQGYRTFLLSGDSSEAASAIGAQLGVHEAIGNLLPEQKLEKVRELLQQGRKVAMVGDGVNDAPALAEATVGIAMGGGTDVALETADITLMTSDLSRLTEVFRIAKRCYLVIMFNFWGTIAVDALGIVLAFFGLLAPIFAALIHVGSELAFILNSARLFRSPIRP
ncbi:MAG TPA: cation-translocating P-type ATPase [Chthoniobacterales bacterium]|nr:cation-translocating P-type ATPase [Chthoniobacterales bacterium]